MDLEAQLKSNIREVPDFPINGVLFKDISPLFLDPGLLKSIRLGLAEPWKGKGITKVMGIESRGFLFGPALAEEIDAGFCIVRKAGKLPPETQSISYSLEYGDATIEVVKDSLVPGDRVLIHDDLLATGGTAGAAARLAESLGAEVVGFSFLINLDFLSGTSVLKTHSDQIHYLVNYAD